MLIYFRSIFISLFLTICTKAEFDKMSFRHIEKVIGVSSQNLNNLLFAHQPKSDGTVIFFGGDVQNLSELMSATRDHKHYVQWSLENVGKILKSAFPTKNILIVRPSRFERATFSCFDNFVESNWNGAPTHSDEKIQALPHLRGLLKSLEKEDFDHCENENGWLVNSNKIIIGFSKGVVVLNQILHEISSLKDRGTKDSCSASGSTDSEDDSTFLKTIFAMSWLDGGHNGGKETWITSTKILEAVNTHGMKIDVRVTPYQIQDDRRPWIGKEEKKFSGFLSKSMDPKKFRRRFFFEAEEPSIENHFRVLETFVNGDEFFV